MTLIAKNAFGGNIRGIDHRALRLNIPSTFALAVVLVVLLLLFGRVGGRFRFSLLLLLGDVLELLSIEFWESLDGVLIDRLNKVDDFVTFLDKSFDEDRILKTNE